MTKLYHQINIALICFDGFPPQKSSKEGSIEEFLPFCERFLQHAVFCCLERLQRHDVMVYKFQPSQILPHLATSGDNAQAALIRVKMLKAKHFQSKNQKKKKMMIRQLCI